MEKKTAKKKDRRVEMSTEGLKEDFAWHLRYSLAKDMEMATPRDQYTAFANAVRDRIVERWKAGKADEVAELCRKSGSILARVVETVFRHRDKAGYQEAKTIAEDKLARELRLENRKASMISTAATLSPLLGLFGTVVGLLGAFGTVAAMGEMGDASVLADDIGKALVTTVAGLAVSMPCLFAYDLVKKRLNFFAVLLEEEISEIVNRIFLKG